MRKIALSGCTTRRNLSPRRCGGVCARAARQASAVSMDCHRLGGDVHHGGSQATPAGGNGNFWLHGGSLDLGFTVLHRFGWAANLTGGHTSNIGPGVGLNVIDFMTGPRYTVRLTPRSKHESRIFVEALAGGARGFSSVFPKSSGLADKASSFAWQAGGGLDISISKHLAIRVFEADYVRSYLPNNSSNVQDHIRLAAGVVYHSTNR